MKKRLFFAALLLALLACATALAQEAADLTGQCQIIAPSTRYLLPKLADRDYGTAYVSDKARHPYIEITAPEDQPIHGVYICFSQKPRPWQVEALRNGNWEIVFESEALYAHEYAPLNGETRLRIALSSDKQSTLAVSELFVLGAGDTPAYVQQWQPAPEKADLLVLSAHPDDEVLFFGGAIPYYAAQRKMNVVVAYMTCGTTMRRSELLNGLWAMGVRNYPVIGEFWDKYSYNLEGGYSAWGKRNTNQYLTGLLRQFKPEVVLTHDAGGEYGHGAHRVCADALLYCVERAADPTKYADSAEKWGVWQVKKMYRHLGDENVIEMDWDQPLEAFGGKTGFEMAQEGYSWHVSQHQAGNRDKATGKFKLFEVEPRDSAQSCYRFSLVYSVVGPDEAKNDFFEHVEMKN